MNFMNSLNICTSQKTLKNFLLMTIFPSDTIFILFMQALQTSSNNTTSSWLIDWMKKSLLLIYFEYYKHLVKSVSISLQFSQKLNFSFWKDLSNFQLTKSHVPLVLLPFQVLDLIKCFECLKFRLWNTSKILTKYLIKKYVEDSFSLIEVHQSFSHSCFLELWVDSKNIIWWSCAT